MKKVFLGLFAITGLLLSSCGSDDTVTSPSSEEGELVAKITFEQSVALRASSTESTAIPKTSWSNVKQLQMFLYNATDGTVAFSAIIDPSTSSDKVFKWTNVPEGTYDLALVANINASSDNIATTLDGGANWTTFDAYNVRGKKLNTGIYIDWKPSEFPTESHTFEQGDKAYAPTSEVFAAYRSGVTITRGETTNLSESALSLEREVSLMRVRIDKTDKAASAPALSTVTFNSASSFIAVHNLPVGMGFKLGSFAGGLLPNSSDSNHILIGASGVNTYNDADPASSDYEPTTILGGDYSLWKDILVWPNATKADGLSSSSDAPVARRYFIVVSALAPANYKFADGSVSTAPQPVYWSGSILGVFSPNVIREVNLKLSSRGYPENPENPENNGSLIITVGAPQPWDHIERETIEL